jgi:hypothetical protein
MNITPEQNEELEKYFRHTRYPSQADEEEIAEELGLTLNSVKVSGDNYYATQNVEGIKKICTTEHCTIKYAIQ